jgi:hypothetical protein
MAGLEPAIHAFPAFERPNRGPSKAVINKSFFASFFAKKEVLPSLSLIGF